MVEKFQFPKHPEPGFPKQLEPSFKELIEKRRPAYTEKEIAILRKFIPSLSKFTDEEIQELFNINGKQLSVFAIIALQALFPKEFPHKTKQLLENEGKLKKHIDNLIKSSKLSQERERELWKVFSILPLTDSVKRYIFQKLVESLQHKIKDKVHSEIETEEELEEKGAIVTLPLTHLPHLDTYLLATHRGSIELPQAVVVVRIGQEEFKKRYQLSPAETAIALHYAMKLINLINRNKDKFIKKYKNTEEYRKKVEEAKGDVEIDFKDVKEYFYKKFMERRLRQLLQEKFPDEAHIFSEKSTKIQLHFVQRKKQLPKEVRKILDDSELCNKYLDQKREESQGQPSMIPLTGLFRSIKNAEDMFELFTFKEYTPKERIPPLRTPSKHPSIRLPNELQEALEIIGKAVKNKNWAIAVEMYIKYLDFWPQYIAHRFGVIDILKRANEGTIELPKRIISIASGPHEEFRAWCDIVSEYEKIPEIVNLDIEFGMLQASRNELIEKRKIPPEVLTKAIDVVGKAQNLPFREKSFDMVECSSFSDFLKKDLVEILIQAIKVLKKGGIMRFATFKPFTEEFCKVLEQNGITIIVKNSQFELSPKIKKELEERGEDKLLERYKQKLKHYFYFLAKVEQEIDIDKLKEDLTKVPIFESHKSFAALSDEEIIRIMDTEINVCRNIAFRPWHYLKRKKLKPENLRYAIQRLKGEINLNDAERLYNIYLQDPKLSLFYDVVFETISECENSELILPLSLLKHDDETVRILFREYLIKKFVYYFKAFINDPELEEEFKIELLHEAAKQPEVVDELSKYLNEVDGDINRLFSISWIFRALPEGTRLDLPIEMRFIPELRGFYFRFSKEKVSEDTYTPSEIKKILEQRPVVFRLDAKFLLFALDVLIKDTNSLLINSFLSYLDTENPERVYSLFGESEEDLQKFKENLQKLLFELREEAKNKKDVKQLLFIIKIEKKYLGISLNDQEKRDILKIIIDEIVEKSTGKRFLFKIDSLVSSLAEEYGVLPLEIQMLLYSRLYYLFTNYPARKRDFNLERTLNYLKEVITSSLKKLVHSDLEKFTEITLLIWSSPEYKNFKEIVKDIIRTHPEITEKPVFVDKILTNLDTNWDLIEFMIDIGRNRNIILHPQIIQKIRSEIDQLKRNVDYMPQRILQIAISSKYRDFIKNNGVLTEEDLAFFTYREDILQGQRLPLNSEDLENILKNYPQLIYHNQCLSLIAKNITDPGVTKFVLAHDEIIEKLFDRQWNTLKELMEQKPYIFANDTFLIFVKKASFEIKKMKEVLRINPTYKPHNCVNSILARYRKAKKENEIPEELVKRIEELISLEDRIFFQGWYIISQTDDLPERYTTWQQLFEIAPDFVLSKGVEKIVKRLNESSPLSNDIVNFILDNENVFASIIQRYDPDNYNESWNMLIIMGALKYPKIIKGVKIIIDTIIDKYKEKLQFYVNRLKENPRYSINDPYVDAIIKDGDLEILEGIISPDNLKFLRAWRTFFVLNSPIGPEEINIFLKLAPNIFKDQNLRYSIVKSVLTDEKIRNYVRDNFENLPKELCNFIVTEILLNYLLSDKKEVEISGARRKIEIGPILEFLNRLGLNRFPVIEISPTRDGKNYNAIIKINIAQRKIFVPTSLIPEDLKRRILPYRYRTFINEIPDLANKVHLSLVQSIRNPDNLVGRIYKE
jgi:ubiquinone/menaquinone biosynthesis C-methylase UbiE